MNEKHRQTLPENVLDEREAMMKRGLEVIQHIADIPLIARLILKKSRGDSSEGDGQESPELPFISKPVVKFVESLEKDIDLEINFSRGVINVYAPVLAGEGKKEKRLRRINLIKEFTPLVASCNMAMIKEMYQWFVGCVDLKTFESFLEELNNLRSGAQL